MRIVVIKDHLTEERGGEETGAMENNEIFVGKGGRWKEEEKEGVIEEKRSRQRT